MAGSHPFFASADPS